ncbi:MAG: hypothetical protein CMJ39_01710 [Phycisphaerae bacterium]|nr:hypothetical protein [Phycisphaerae bacterium]
MLFTNVLCVLAVVAGADQELEQRLDRLVAEMEEAREDYRVPGMTLGVVKDGEIVLVKAFGTRNLETGEPMSVDTPMPIGSATKAFTATAIGMLVDQGKMNWDDPVSQHLPSLNLQIQSDDPDAAATIRDLLCHRTGYPRMGVLWAGLAVEPEIIFETASRAEPQAEFRERFLYNNIMYLAAGEASAAAAGMSWEELVQSRIIDPLDMDATIMIADTPKEIELMSLGYQWNPDIDGYDLQPFRVIDNCSPAGSICSTPEDMGRWLQFLLAQGMAAEQRLISTDSLDETIESHIQMMPELDYGLGWMLEEWEGRQVIQHGGNIDGYSAMVACIPEENIGFTLLMNTMPTAMQEASRSMVWRNLLSEIEEQSEDGDEKKDLQQYVGNYIANFASFNDAVMKVTAADGTLFLDVPGQMNFELIPPAEGEDKWPFKMTDTIAVSFHPDDQGQIASMKMYQSGMTFELPREGRDLPSGPFKKAESTRLLGSYQQVNEPIAGRVDEVRFENGWLVIDVPQQMAFKLSPADEDGLHAFRDFDGLALSFTEDADGNIDGLIIYQGGMEFPGRKMGGLEDAAVGDPLPSVEELAELVKQYGSAEQAGKEVIRIAGSLSIPSSGVQGSFELLLASPSQFRILSDFGPFGRSITVVDGEFGSEKSDFAPDRILDGTELVLVKSGGPGLSSNWPSLFDSVVVEDWAEIEGEQAVKVTATPSGFDQPFVLYLDPETGLVRKAEGWIFAPNIGPYPMNWSFDPPREINGHELVSGWQASGPEIGSTVFEVVEVSTVPMSPDMFKMNMQPE